MHNAASFDWETLLPVLFFILYGVAQFLGSKKKGGAAEEEAGSGEPEVDPMERARQIREEIRRKIEERRRAMEGPTAQPPRPAYDPTMSEAQQRRQAPAPAAAPAPAETAQQSFERLLQEQRRRLEESRRRQQEAHEQALRMEQAAGVTRAEPQAKRAKAAEAAGGGAFRDQVLAGLRGPAALRKAVLYREILGPPVGLR